MKQACRRGISRRRFIKSVGAAAGMAAFGLPILSNSAGSSERFEARYYEKMEGGKVRCLLCPRGCVISVNQTGYCGVRKNIEGRLYSLIYGEACSVHSDPIEKKPFFHVLPGTRSLSLSTVGCNMECKFCQNWQISQSSPQDIKTRFISPGQMVGKAVDLNIPSITFTYGEPAIFIEYAQDIARIAEKEGLRSFVVTNGFYREKPLSDLCRVVDAVKIDLKAFTEEYYRKICDAELRPVLDSIIKIREEGIWLELVYLMLPTLNDSTREIRSMARWLVRNVGEEVPLHFSKFFPQYKLKNLPPTPVSSLEKAYDISREEGLKYVYIGNVPGHPTESTFCPSCSRKIIDRRGYRVENLNMEEGRCGFCQEAIPGIWKA